MLIPVEIGVWTLYATIPPGCKGVVSHQDYGLIDIERDMAVDVEALIAHGVGRLVSMMSADDVLASGMGGLLTDLEGAGIEWTHLPFPSRRIPDEGFPRYLAEQAEVIRMGLTAGVKIAVHGSGWGPSLLRTLPRLVMSVDSDIHHSEAAARAYAAAITGRAIIPM